jgi:hypothetical protein
MPLLESLYRPTIKDRSAGLNQRIFRQNGFTSFAGSTVQTISSPVPADTLQVVMGIQINASPGAAQSCLQLNASLQSPFGTTILTMNEFPNPPLAVLASWGFCWIPLNWEMTFNEVLLLSAVFSGGAAPNQVATSAWGYRVPRGNVETAGTGL